MKRLATLCLILSLLSFGQACVDEYNREVAQQELDREMKASYGITFSHDWGWSIDYSVRNRNLILMLSIGAFFVTVCARRRMVAMLVSLFLYSLTALLAYQWISWVVDSLAMNDIYRPDIPYLSRIASNFDWLMFAGLALTIVVNIAVLNKAVNERALLAPMD
jgi:hypothetical protein